jgi:hypothetical protein
MLTKQIARISMESALIRRIRFLLLLLALCFATVAQGQEPVKLTPCQLKSDPDSFNHKLIEVTGFVSFGFEDFTLFDPACPSWPPAWLEYGGKDKAGTMYCCGVTSSRDRPKELEVEKIVIPLVDDDRFHQFDSLVHQSKGSVVHATIVGRYFAGELQHYPKGDIRGGYGHMGCCPLLAVQQILTVDPHDRDDLDYVSYLDQPESNKVGCGYRYLVSLEPYSELIEAQRNAEIANQDWVFDDPNKVAAEALSRLANLDPKSEVKLREKRRTQGRIVYEWKPGKSKQKYYMIVVNRPYWLSFYSKDSRRVAWVVSAAYESSCDSGNSVARIK